jgi:hypothetical protein
VGRLQRQYHNIGHRWEILRAIWSYTYTYANTNTDSDSVTDSDSNTYTYADANTLHGEMCTDAEAAPNARAAAVAAH